MMDDKLRVLQQSIQTGDLELGLAGGGRVCSIGLPPSSFAAAHGVAFDKSENFVQIFVKPRGADTFSEPGGADVLTSDASENDLASLDLTSFDLI